MPRRLAGEAPYCTLNHLHSRNHPHFSTELQQMNRVLNHRQKKGDTAVSPWRPLCFLSELITNEPADFYVLPNARDHLATQLINRLIRVFDKGLFKQHHLFQPLVQLALGDLLNHMIWLARLPRLRRVDVPLSFDFRFWNIYARHPLWRRSGNVHGKIVDKTLKLIVTGDEVRLTVDLQQHTYLPTLMHIRVNQSLAERPDFLSAVAIPLVRRSFSAVSPSPPASSSAFLQSIMPAPVLSRSSFTSLALILISTPVSVTLLRRPQHLLLPRPSPWTLPPLSIPPGGKRYPPLQKPQPRDQPPPPRLNPRSGLPESHLP